MILALVLGVSALYAGKGKVRISSDHKGAYVYVDGKKKAMTGEGFTSILLEEGEYTIKITKAVSDQYEMYASTEVFVGEDTSTKLILNPDIYAPTAQYAKVLTELDKPKLERWQRNGEIVTDTKLGLMWQDNSRTKSTKKNWKEAKKYCQDLSFGGYNDWKLPSYDELTTIVDYDRCDPAIIPSFINVNITNPYWSSSEYVKNKNEVWYMRFSDGYLRNNYNKTDAYNVRCIRNNKIRNLK